MSRGIGVSAKALEGTVATLTSGDQREAFNRYVERGYLLLLEVCDTDNWGWSDKDLLPGNRDYASVGPRMTIAGWISVRMKS